MSKKYYIYGSIISLIIALVFLFVPADFLSIVYFRLVAISFVLMGLFKLAFTSLKDEKRELIFNIIEGTLGIILGVIYYHFYNYLTVDIICFLGLGAIPILRLIYASHLINQVSFDFLKYIGLISLLGGYNKVNKGFFIFCGIVWLLIIVAIWLFYFIGRRSKDEEN